MAPAFDARDILQFKAVLGRVVPSCFFAGQKHTGGAIGNLPAVHFAHPTLNHGIVLIIICITLRLELPVPRLGIGIAAAIIKVDLRDGFKMITVNPVAGIIFINNLIKHIGPGEVTAGGFHCAYTPAPTHRPDHNGRPLYRA